MAVNPFLQFLKYAGDPKKALLINDVDLAIQPSMCTITTEQQRSAMWDLYEITEGGLLIFTGRTPQSSQRTFGRDYPGVFEHYSLARFGLGQCLIFMAPEINIEQLAGLSQDSILSNGSVKLVGTPGEIGGNKDLAVYIEKKNASIALVHTTIRPAYNGDPAPLQHLQAIRQVLVPIAKDVIESMGIEDTHMLKQGNDAIEIVPKGLDSKSEATSILPEQEIKRITESGLSKATALHNFKPFFENRVVHMLGDGDPDMDVAIEIKKEYSGWGTYVSNGVSLPEHYHHAVRNDKGDTSIIDNHKLTWPLLIDTATALQESLPKHKMPLPPAGGMVPNLRGLN